MPVRTRTFRLFISSTFEDLKGERDALQRDVFPSLRSLCLRHGARFQAIDLRWGVRDEAALDQKTMEICLREIERCQRTGIKPNFVVLLGQRYGWRPLPPRIEAGEFDSVRACIAPPRERTLVESWYRRDENALPAEYLLQPRTGEAAEPARWQALETDLHRILRQAARAAALPEQQFIKYDASATHQEILTGLGAGPEQARHVFAFCRMVPDSACDPELTALKQYLRDRIPAENFVSYSPGDLAGLCRRVEEALGPVMEREAAAFESKPGLVLEMEAHQDFARERSASVGRQRELRAIASYLKSGPALPLVVRGPSGSGKTTLMARAYEDAIKADPRGLVLVRFIGASPESSSALTLLSGMSELLGRAFGATGELPADFDGIARAFRERLALATAEAPLVILLDAIDQLAVESAARPLDWLAGPLPPYCRVVISTIDLPAALRECPQVEVSAWPRSDAAATLDAWLAAAGRRLQPEQRKRILEAYDRCGLPLYLKLAFEEARGWRSFMPAAECRLGEGVPGVIDTLLDRLSQESNHGPLLVSRGLACLAASRYGLAEDEILDVLSADPEVWSDFEQRAHHAVRERRLPVILWSRLFLDLESYLNERPAPGGTVISFYHRQLAERAAARFLSGPDAHCRHAALAEYFGNQPNWLDREQRLPNARRVSELIKHQLDAGRIEDAISSLTNLEYLAAKCGAGLVLDLETDYQATISSLPEARSGIEEEAQRHEKIARWVRDLVAYSHSATEEQLRSGLRVALRGLCRRVGLPGGSPEHPPEAPAAVKLWPDTRIRAEWLRLVENPARLDTLRLFERFVRAEHAALNELGRSPGLLYQHAANYAPAGPVHAEGSARAAHCRTPVLVRLWSERALYNPMPALLRTLEGHADDVRHVTVLGDGRRAASASADTIRVWDLQTGVCLLKLDDDVAVHALSVTPDGRRAVSAGRHGHLRIWDLETGACLHKGKSPAGQINCLAITPDGRMAISGEGDLLTRQEGTLHLWDLLTGACLRTLEGHSHPVHGVSLTPDARRAVSVGADKTLRVWDLERASCLHTLTLNSPALRVRITPDGTRAVSAHGDRLAMDDSMRLWDLESGACLHRFRHRGRVLDVDITPDGSLAVAACADHTLRVWNLGTGDCDRILEGHTGEVLCASLAPDGRIAVSGGDDSTLRVWNVESGACPRTLQSHRHHVTGGGGFSFGLADTLRTVKEHRGRVNALQVLPGGRTLVSAGDDGCLRVWDLGTGAFLRSLDAHHDSVFIVSALPGGRLVVSGSHDRTLRLWDVETGECLRTLSGHNGWISGLCITPGGDRAVSSSSDRTLRVWTLKSGECLHVLEGHQEEVLGLDLLPDGRRAISAGRDCTLRLWDLDSGACLRVLEGHKRWVMGVSVSADGRIAVSASADGTLGVWDLASGQLMRTLEGHRDMVERVYLNPAGDRAVSEGYGDAARVWDLATGQCARTLDGFLLHVTPDRRQAVSTSAGHELCLWDVDSGKCLARVRGEASWRAAELHFSRLVAGSTNGTVAFFNVRGPGLEAAGDGRVF